MNLTKFNFYSEQGFTLIEALVSLAIFSIGFSGLFFFFGMSQSTIDRSDKKLYVSLMADNIVETIVAETRRLSSDTLNPFVTPASYNADLSNCGAYPVSDVRYTWCTDLNSLVGPLNSSSGLETRAVTVRLSPPNAIIVDVNFVVESGVVQTSMSKKIRQ